MGKSGLKETVIKMSRSLAKYLLMAALGAGLLLPQTPVFRTKVSMVHVVATVKNKSGDLVGTLHKDDFEVYDNGVRQTVTNFDHLTAQPLSVALMIDTSGSTNKDLKYETDSAAKFFKALLSEGNPEDAVALFSFNDTVRLERDFTHNYPSLESRLKFLKGSAGTSLYDAIYYSAQALDRREGRKVMVVISDGGNTTSTTLIHAATEGNADGRRGAVPGADHAHHQCGRPQYRRRTCIAVHGGEHRWTHVPAQGGQSRPGLYRPHSGAAHAICAGVLCAGCAAHKGAVSQAGRPCEKSGFVGLGAERLLRGCGGRKRLFGQSQNSDARRKEKAFAAVVLTPTTSSAFCGQIKVTDWGLKPGSYTIAAKGRRSNSCARR
jgi:hypothetical protein